METFINFLFTGTEEAENGFLHMRTGWFRMTKLKYSMPRSGNLKEIITGAAIISASAFPAPVIYEAHIGMAYAGRKNRHIPEFTEKVLPVISKSGYNTIQLMAIQEHPFYGSFGYHVSSFFAASSRFGTPEDLKELIDKAHQSGLRVIMDLVHSHSVKNVNEGLGLFDGSLGQYFHANERRRNHIAWDSLCFDYGKDNVIHFLSIQLPLLA